MIKFWAFVYRLTGYYSPFAELAEYHYIRSKMDDIEKYYLENLNDKYGRMSLDDVVGIEIGMWQAKHGFYRKMRFK